MRTAIGIIRVSRVNGRKGESFVSPGEQRQRIEDFCAREGLALLDIHEELDISGGLPLAERPGLGPTVEAVEAGEAQVVVGAYLDRICRSLAVQHELVSRVEDAGGQVVALDVGKISNGSAGQWLSASVLGLMAEYQRRSTTERSHEAQQDAINRGVCPFPNVPPGLRLRDDRRLEADPETGPLVVKAFKLRASGATVQQIRSFLAANGIRRSFHAVGHMLRSRIYRGELHFGRYTPNLAAYEPPLIDADLFNRVQRMVVSRGRRAKSERLLARLDVLRCGSCGSRMSVSSGNHGHYPAYRCPPTNDCADHLSVSAPLVEGVVVEAVKEALRGVEGRASAEQGARDAEHAAVAAQAALDAGIRAFSVVADEPAAVERLTELRRVRDEAEAHAEHLRGHSTVVSLTAARDWDRLSLQARRGLVRATVERVTVAPGKGAGRVSVKLVGE